jgi:hypothetical protein
VCKREKEGGKERKNREKIKFFIIIFEENELPRKNKKIKKCPVSRAQGWGVLLPC